MLHIRGRKPETGHAKFLAVLIRFIRQQWPIALFVAFATMAAAQAQQAIPLTLAEAEDLALAAEPGQAALIAKAAALGEQAIVSEQLPDPTLRAGLANFPIQSGGFTSEAMTQAQLIVRQAFPAGKSRDASRRQFESMSLEMTDAAGARGRDVLMATRRSWLESYYWRRAADIVAESRPFFSDLATITRSLYSVGSKTQYDVLRSELELSRLDDRLIDIERQQSGSRAALSEWIGEESRRPVAEKLPSWNELPALHVLHGNLLAHPAVTAADAGVAARLAGVEVAKEKFKPGWAIDLGYGFRGGYLPSGEARSDMVSLSITMDLPVFRGNRQNRSLAAALSERRAAEGTREQLLRRLRSQIDTEYARWQDLSRRLQLYDERILGQAGAQAQAALLAYQSEAGDFADVMRGYIDDLNTRLDYERLQVERAQSYAVLANLGGLSR
ncbi:MAG: TolC family protein [Gammaproteobacteria bacterium]|nr:TolC family protein [Gammaproteobacteria bacterium]MDH4313212.1 TolC family protein [Gammaproteobacteria bacterium]MDH5215633.1 TolC family protein [Gammaproteobacteria bacterium]MDH5502226.1 TolC family protein [Gammaproteobacteria bacterium]